jgi:hypothetical protein
MLEAIALRTKAIAVRAFPFFTEMRKHANSLFSRNSEQKAVARFLFGIAAETGRARAVY